MRTGICRACLLCLCLLAKIPSLNGLTKALKSAGTKAAKFALVTYVLITEELKPSPLEALNALTGQSQA
jgi:hypothetical protein